MDCKGRDGEGGTGQVRRVGKSQLPEAGPLSRGVMGGAGWGRSCTFLLSRL